MEWLNGQRWLAIMVANFNDDITPPPPSAFRITDEDVFRITDSDDRRITD